MKLFNIILEITVWNIYGFKKANNMYWNKYFAYSISNIFKNLFGCESIYVSSSCLCKCDELSSVIKPSCQSSASEALFRTFQAFLFFQAWNIP
jgi:hypothetical protein